MTTIVRINLNISIPRYFKIGSLDLSYIIYHLNYQVRLLVLKYIF